MLVGAVFSPGPRPRRIFLPYHIFIQNTRIYSIRYDILYLISGAHWLEVNDIARKHELIISFKKSYAP